MAGPAVADDSSQSTSGFDRGPVQWYEITWETGHIEKFPSHQIWWPDNATSLFNPQSATGRERVEIHAEINGHWTLQLSAQLRDIRTIRNVTTDEVVTADEVA